MSTENKQNSSTPEGHHGVIILTQQSQRNSCIHAKPMCNPGHSLILFSVLIQSLYMQVHGIWGKRKKIHQVEKEFLKNLLNPNYITCGFWWTDQEKASTSLKSVSQPVGKSGNLLIIDAFWGKEKLLGEEICAKVYITRQASFQNSVSKLDN